MNDYLYIIENNRFKKKLSDYSNAFIFLLGLSLVFSIYGNEVPAHYRIPYLMLCFLIMSLISIIIDNRILRKISFIRIQNFSTQSCKEIIHQVMAENKLVCLNGKENIFYSRYYLTYFLNFKVKIEVFFIVVDSTILCNIKAPNNDEAFFIKDKIKLKILKSLKQKCIQK